MDGTGILMLAVGLVGGILLGGMLKPPCPVSVPGGSKGWADVVLGALPIGKDIFDSFGNKPKTSASGGVGGSAGVFWAGDRGF